MSGISEQARAEAERRWDGAWTHAAMRDAFVAGVEWAASLTPEPSSDVREALAREIFIASDSANAEHMAAAWDAPGPHGRARWHAYADAVLSRFNVTPKTTNEGRRRVPVPIQDRIDALKSTNDSEGGNQ